MGKTLPASTLQQLKNFDSPTVSNAVEAFKTRPLTEGYASMELRCSFKDLPPMLGYAVTCTADSTSREVAGRDHLVELFDAVAEAPKPAVVVVQNRGADRLRTCFAGDVICTALQKLGAVGLVTDGGVRDVRGIAEHAPGFQVFTPGVVVSHGNATILEVEVPVTICGMTVQPGELLHGDASGILIIPADIAEKIPEQASLIRDTERQLFEFFSSDAFSVQTLKKKLRP